jgi:D-amino-acid dehydrogenase
VISRVLLKTDPLENLYSFSDFVFYRTEELGDEMSELNRFAAGASSSVRNCDVIVLGAGIVGVAAALHLQKRGRETILFDRDSPGKGTSYGNAGLIQSEAYLPYQFPTSLTKLLRYALNGETEAHYQLSGLLGVAPALFKYWRNARPERLERTIRTNRPLFDNCIAEHEALAAEAGITDLMRKGGWIQIFRKEATLLEKRGEAQRLKDEFGVQSEELSTSNLAALEPHLSVEKTIGALHWKRPVSLRDPLELTEGYADLFKRRGGQFVGGDARTLTQTSTGWQITTTEGVISARDVVLALGPWSSDVFKPLGYDIPLFSKRGYHMHYKARGNATLSRPLIDSDTGFALASMTKGVRLTTGAEFANRDAPPTPVQLDRCEPLARELFPLESRAEEKPWLGRRPALPDMVPVIGPAPRHKGLWFLFGHAHHGLTNAAVSGRLIAELITGEPTLCDVSGFRADRAYS